MSEEQRKTSPVSLAKRDIKELLDNVLNFGPETPHNPPDVSDRLRELVKKLQEINRRIDNLSSRL